MKSVFYMFIFSYKLSSSVFGETPAQEGNINGGFK